jgi:hypothetical protein
LVMERLRLPRRSVQSIIGATQSLRAPGAGILCPAGLRGAMAGGSSAVSISSCIGPLRPNPCALHRDRRRRLSEKRTAAETRPEQQPTKQLPRTAAAAYVHSPGRLLPCDTASVSTSSSNNQRTMAGALIRHDGAWRTRKSPRSMTAVDAVIRYR